MPPTVRVKTSDSLVKKEREEIAHRVLAQLEDSLSDCRLLCFFDDEDCQEIKLDMGESNRAVHAIISDRTRLTGWPKYITDYIFVGPSSFFRKPVFNQVVYLHGSTCADSVGMTMSFAHELQHVIQRVNVPELLTANGLFRHLPKTVLQNVGLLQWSDIPTEREARAVAKKIAVTLHGSEAVNEFLEQRAASAKDPLDRADALFIQGLDTSAPYILRDETLKLFGRFRNYRAELESLIEEFRLAPDFEPVQLNSFMPPVIPNSKQ